jgi:iron-only hydrogenase group A
MITARINGITVKVPVGTTILEAAKKVQVKIPTLCAHPDLRSRSSCGICIVKAKGINKMLRACCTPIEKDMDIITHDAEIVEIRRTVIELILSKHPNECLTCTRNHTCELQQLAADFGILRESFPQIEPKVPYDDSTGAIAVDRRKCILCGRCVDVCQMMQNVWALSFLDRGIDARVAPAGEITLEESPCIRCGQCSAHCPTGAIVEHDDTPQVWAALQNPDLHCVVQIAPAVRIAIGDILGYPPGTNLTRKLYAAFRRLGFDSVFDTNFGADVTIVEEGTEFVHRFTKAPEQLPLITSCCPAWVDFMEKYHHDVVPHFSSCKSPHQIVGALAKTFYAKKRRHDPEKIFVVSIMPCTAKKYEITRCKEMYASGYKDVDIVITTRELARMIKQSGIDFNSLVDEDADSILGEYTGAGTIFGVTGGVMEAALRTAYYAITGGKLANIEFENVRGFDGVKEGAIPIHGTTVKVAVAHGIGNVEYVLNRVVEAKRKGEEPPYHFIEVMACPGGCIGGGGQPYGITNQIRAARAAGLYEDDRDSAIRYSHENPSVKALYDEYIGKPLGERSHHLFHTGYTTYSEYKR